MIEYETISDPIISQDGTVLIGIDGDRKVRLDSIIDNLYNLLKDEPFYGVLIESIKKSRYHNC